MLAEPLQCSEIHIDTQAEQQQMPPAVHILLSQHPVVADSARSPRAGPLKEGESSPKLTTAQAKAARESLRAAARASPIDHDALCDVKELTEERRATLVRYVNASFEERGLPQTCVGLRPFD